MIPQHPDDPSNWHPEMRGDLGEAFEKLVSSIREDDKLIREVRDIANPPKPVDINSIKQ